MNVLVEIDDARAPFFFELMKNIRAKTTRLSPEKARTMKGIREAVEEVNRAKRGEVQLPELKEFLKEL